MFVFATRDVVHKLSMSTIYLFDNFTAHIKNDDILHLQDGVWSDRHVCAATSHATLHR